MVVHLWVLVHSGRGPDILIAEISCPKPKEQIKTYSKHSVGKWVNSSIHTGAQYGTLQKDLSHLSLLVYFFSNPTHKTERGSANRWELLIANHLDESL
jgi:hypothetical protein